MEFIVQTALAYLWKVPRQRLAQHDTNHLVSTSLRKNSVLKQPGDDTFD